ncbi:hypothetical protein EDD15DRAFT_2446367 [Pisolithus albus]|nr:hypothetical protein EDD15DRAFT_2446367 [Pisolithus albus]
MLCSLSFIGFDKYHSSDSNSMLATQTIRALLLSSMAAEPSTVIRVAIAFAALKHKPRDQSTTSYLLDLQTQFPLANQTISSQTQDSAERWRAHTLRLESQLKEIQARQDIDQQELVQLRAYQPLPP